MSYAAQIREAEQDLARLFRIRQEVEADLQAVSRLPIAEQHPALFKLTSKHPGLLSIGFLLSLSDNDRRSLLSTLWPQSPHSPHREFAQRLLQLVQDSEGLSLAFGGLMPSTLPSRPALDWEPVHGGEPDQESENHQITTRKPLSPELTRLLKILTAPDYQFGQRFSDPISGHLAGTNVSANNRLSVSIEDQGSLKIHGILSSENYFARRVTKGRRAIHDDCDLTFADGSRLYGEMFAMNEYLYPEGKFHGEIHTWRWWNPGSVHHWVSYKKGSLSRIPRNFSLVHDAHLLESGIHFSGDPEITLVHAPGNDGDIFEIIRNIFPQEQQETSVIKVSNLVSSIVGLPRPLLVLGYDAKGQLISALGRTPATIERPRLLFVPKGGLGMIFDHRGQPDTMIWLLPFLRRLLAKYLTPRSVVRESIDYWQQVAMHEKYVEQQIAALGTAIRMLLFVLGVIREEGWLDYEYVGAKLDNFSASQGIHLPDGAAESMQLSHRIALLGNFGKSRSNIEIREQARSGRLQRHHEVLRLTYISLLSALIEYPGPLFAGLDPETGASLLHYPLRKPRPEAVAEDEALASQQFVVDLDA